MNQVVLQFSTTASIWTWRPPFYPNWASVVIRRMSHSPFSHVDLELPNGSLLGASNSPKAPIISGNPRGVAIRPNNYELYGFRRRMIIDTNLAQYIHLAALSQIGKPFDNSALRGFLSDKLPGNRDWRDPEQWFCSELIVWALELAGFWHPLKATVWPKNRISPSDIFMVLLFDRRWSNRETFWDVPALMAKK
jgi:hypothetical protein